jgi:hypothetical protein
MMDTSLFCTPIQSAGSTPIHLQLVLRYGFGGSWRAGVRDEGVEILMGPGERMMR